MAAGTIARLRWDGQKDEPTPGVLPGLARLSSSVRTVRPPEFAGLDCTVFLQWLQGAHPELMGRYRELFRGGQYLPEDYRREVGVRMRAVVLF